MPADPICPGGVKVELNADGGATWDDITDWVGRIDPGARERTVLTYQTFSGPKSCIGPAAPVNIELEFLYTEADTEPYAVIRAAHYAGTVVGVRWQATTGTGAKVWTAATATVPTFDEPELNATSDTGIIVLATLSADVIDWAVAA